MPPATKKNVSVILYDVNCEKRFQEAAKRCLMNIWSTKWFSASKDCTKLILLNTAETDIENPKFSNVEHICEATSVIPYTPQILRQHLEDVQVGNGDWVVGLALAIEALKSLYVSVKAVMNLQLLLISDFSNSPSEFKPHQIQFIQSSLENLNCFLYILGPKVKVPTHLSAFKDVREWSKKVEFVEEETPSLRVVKEIVEGTTNSIVCDLDLGEELFCNYYTTWSLQAWLVPLTIGTELVIPSSMIRFLRATNPPKIKPQDIGRSSWSWHLSTDVNAEVAYDNVVGGVFKHGKFVPLPKDVENNFKCHEARCFKIVGFTDRRNIKEMLLCGNGSAYVQGSNSINFDLLLHVLAKKNLCAIAKRIYIANCRPTLYAMFPDVKHGVFIATALPFQDNVAPNVNEQDVQDAPEIDNPLTSRVYEFLNRLDVSNSENVDESGSVKVPINGALMTPIRSTVIFRQLQQKYFGNNITPQDFHSSRVLDNFEPYFDLCSERRTQTDNQN